ncbi:hypothetical protein [uncultured Novosphingobium sp.]|uniref:hypothetical protein n=1 Tax=uncultured Novosphingobium sp. TaxID=292277 RepID=UPI003747F36C
MFVRFLQGYRTLTRAEKPITVAFSNPRNDLAKKLPLLRQKHHHLVRMRNIQVPAQQFAGKVRVGLMRIKQINAVAQLAAQLIQLCDLLLMLDQEPLILAPSEEAAGARDDEPAHQQQRYESAGLDGTVLDEFGFPARRFHTS